MLADWQAQNRVVGWQLEAVDCCVMRKDLLLAERELLELIWLEDFFDFCSLSVSAWSCDPQGTRTVSVDLVTGEDDRDGYCDWCPLDLGQGGDGNYESCRNVDSVNVVLR